MLAIEYFITFFLIFFSKAQTNILKTVTVLVILYGSET
jgi:hypothetical protein